MVCKVSLSIDKIIIFKGALMSEKTKCLLVLNHVLSYVEKCLKFMNLLVTSKQNAWCWMHQSTDKQRSVNAFFFFFFHNWNAINTDDK